MISYLALFLSYQDINMKIISFSQQGPRAICILSANGVISNVTLRQHDSLGGTVTYEVRSLLSFEMISMYGVPFYCVHALLIS